jgi:transcriptional regulator with XRE-family HTH domain
VREFLGLSEIEARMIDLHLALAGAIRPLRLKVGLTQTELAGRLGSSQSRVAKIEAGDPSVSLDLIVRALFAAGATRKELQRAFLAKEKISA